MRMSFQLSRPWLGGSTTKRNGAQSRHGVSAHPSRPSSSASTNLRPRVTCGRTTSQSYTSAPRCFSRIPPRALVRGGLMGEGLDRKIVMTACSRCVGAARAQIIKSLSAGVESLAPEEALSVLRSMAQLALWSTPVKMERTPFVASSGGALVSGFGIPKTARAESGSGGGVGAVGAGNDGEGLWEAERALGAGLVARVSELAAGQGALGLERDVDLLWALAAFSLSRVFCSAAPHGNVRAVAAIRDTAGRIGSGWKQGSFSLPGGGVDWKCDTLTLSSHGVTLLAHAYPLVQLRATSPSGQSDAERGLWKEAGRDLERVGERALALWREHDRASKAPLAKALSAAFPSCRLRPHIPAQDPGVACAVLGGDVLATPERPPKGSPPPIICLQILLRGDLIAEPGPASLSSAPAFRLDGRSLMRRAVLISSGLVPAPVIAADASAQGGAGHDVSARLLPDRALQGVDTGEASEGRDRTLPSVDAMEFEGMEAGSPFPDYEFGGMEARSPSPEYEVDGGGPSDPEAGPDLAKMKGGKKRKRVKDGFRVVKKENGKRLLWTLHYSTKKEKWYYVNVNTHEKMWSAPDVEGWVKKESSGIHRPYVGLKTYYFQPSTHKCSYEVPAYID
ncbi:hypothetical protein T484DRAFT_1895098 [Baffinella frigidus]|nr:hypothetical protein T484DRAFT_1895098 [Cryptophyta sp. CCMP2293]